MQFGAGHSFTASQIIVDKMNSGFVNACLWSLGYEGLEFRSFRLDL